MAKITSAALRLPVGILRWKERDLAFVIKIEGPLRGAHDLLVSRTAEWLRAHWASALDPRTLLDVVRVNQEAARSAPTAHVKAIRVGWDVEGLVLVQVARRVIRQQRRRPLEKF